MILLRAPAAPFVPEEWHGRRICGMAVCYSGDLGAVDEVLAPIRALDNPIVDLLAEQPYTQVQSYLDATEPKGAHYYWKTEYLAELSDDLLSTTRDLFAECPIPEATSASCTSADLSTSTTRTTGLSGTETPATCSA